MKMTTLCYIEQNQQYLMLHRIKKQQDVNQGKWIGVGGHLEEGETPEECLVREVLEETGLTLQSYRLRGLVTFVSDVYEQEMMFLYTADSFTGELCECNEGVLQWIAKEDILSLPMWEGDAVFLKQLLQDEPHIFSLKLEYKGEQLVHTSQVTYSTP